MGRQFVDHLVYRLAGLDHDEDGPGLGDARDKVGEGAGRNKAAFVAMPGHQVSRPLVVAVEERDAEPVPRGVARKVRAHDGQSQNADVSLFRHVFLPRFPDKTSVLALRAAYP